MSQPDDTMWRLTIRVAYQRELIVLDDEELEALMPQEDQIGGITFLTFDGDEQHEYLSIRADQILERELKIAPIIEAETEEEAEPVEPGPAPHPLLGQFTP